MTRALVLGGGGPVGIAWEMGIAVGLARRAVELTASDAVYGTSAGAFVGAQIALGADLAANIALLAASPAALAAEEGGATTRRMQTFMAALASSVLSGASPDEVRVGLARLSLAASTPGEQEFLELFALLEGQPWPEGFACTAVEAATGEFVVWRAESVVELRRAVASSCAVPCVYPPVTIGGRRFVDGGLQSILNAELARGHGRILVLSAIMLTLPPGTSEPSIDALLGPLAAELAALRSSGSALEVVEPNAEFLELSAFGTALMDFELAPAAYEIGIRQGVEESRRIGELWNRSGV